MAGAKRRLEDGNDLSQDGNVNIDVDVANSAESRRSEDPITDGPPKKRPKTHGSLQRHSIGAAGCGHLAADRAFLALSPGTDYLSPLSDELLVRILSNLPMTDLLSLAPVSRRFHRLADDSQLWKAIYYERFVLPRAMRISGIRSGSLTNKTNASNDDDTSLTGVHGESQTTGARHRNRHHHHQQQQQQALGGEAGPTIRESSTPGQRTDGNGVAFGTVENRQAEPKPDWKQQYRLRHNWARGKCAVEELRLDTGRSRGNRLKAAGQGDRDEEGFDLEGDSGVEDENGDGNFHRMLVKVVDGNAVTADRKRGLRIWELKSRSLVAAGQFTGKKPPAEVGGKPTSDVVDNVLGQEIQDSTIGETGSKKQDDTLFIIPTSLAIDLNCDTLDIAIGLLDGGFDIWQHDLGRKTLVRRFSHPASSSGPLTGIAYSHPYVLTATDCGLISLYAFGPDSKPHYRTPKQPKALDGLVLNAPRLMTSLRSHTSQPPLALSIRKLSSVTIASIAYTFSTRQGWSIGIQDLHVKEEAPDGGKAARSDKRGLPTVVVTRLAHTLPVVAGHGRGSISANARRQTRVSSLSSLLRTGSPSRISLTAQSASTPSSLSSPPSAAMAGHQILRRDSYEDGRTDDGPTSLCYNHPYLLATMPDNTLILHLCTSNASTLAISSGIRLWGHTSGISDAEITARGKAVSVSMRGEEMRVWELEGRPAAERGRSVAIRPNTGDGDAGAESLPAYHWDERRNWVGFDDEMVIVLKETHSGRESLMVYDFT